MRARLLVPTLVVAALPLAGCGGGGAGTPVALQAPLPVRQLPSKPPPVMAKAKLIRRAEGYCKRLNASVATWGEIPGFDPANPIASVQRTNAAARRWVVKLRRAYRRFHALGIPRRGLARRRWLGFLSQFQALVNHFDEVQAGAGRLDMYYTRDSLRQLRKATNALVRRGHRLGLRACVS